MAGTNTFCTFYFSSSHHTLKLTFGLIVLSDKKGHDPKTLNCVKTRLGGVVSRNCDAFSNNNDNIFSVYFTNKSRTRLPHALHPRLGSSWGGAIIAVVTCTHTALLSWCTWGGYLDAMADGNRLEVGEGGLKAKEN